MRVAAESRTTRRSEIEDCFGPMEFGPRAGFRDDVRTDPERCRRFRLCIENCGPLFAAFGRYLSSRLDLIPALLRQELARISDIAAPTPPAQVREICCRELGRPPELAFRQFDPEPFRSHFFSQAHYGMLGDAEVIVKMVHPDIDRRLADTQYLWLLEPPLAAFGVDAAGFKAAVVDFEHETLRMRTFEADLDAARLLARDAEGFDLLGAPRVFLHLSGPHVAVYRRWQRPDEVTAPAADLARAMCTVWLRQSLRGVIYPVEPGLGNIAFAEDGRVIFPSGPFATLPDPLKAGLWNYLVAISTDNIDAAAVHLAAAVGGETTNSANEELQRRIRRADPFREGFRGTDSGAWPIDGQQFSENIFVHWKIAAEQNLMSEALICFYRGLFAIAGAAQSLAPGRDWLAEGMRDVRLLTAFAEVKETMRPSQMAAMAKLRGSLHGYA